MYPIRQLICGDHGCGKTAALVQSAADLLTSGCDSAEILALSVHRPAVRGLRTAFRERLSLDIPTADVRRRATALLEQFPAAAHLPAGWAAGGGGGGFVFLPTRRRPPPAPRPFPPCPPGARPARRVWGGVPPLPA